MSGFILHVTKFANICISQFVSDLKFLYILNITGYTFCAWYFSAMQRTENQIIASITGYTIMKICLINYCLTAYRGWSISTLARYVKHLYFTMLECGIGLPISILMNHLVAPWRPSKEECILSFGIWQLIGYLYFPGARPSPVMYSDLFNVYMQV